MGRDKVMALIFTEKQFVVFLDEFKVPFKVLGNRRFYNVEEAAKVLLRAHGKKGTMSEKPFALFMTQIVEGKAFHRQVDDHGNYAFFTVGFVGNEDSMKL